MKHRSECYDLVVCGGGLAGFSAAVAAARRGRRAALLQDRPVLGGNSSSEVRVTPHGAANFHAYARETGIISECLIEERYRNHEPIEENGWTNNVWDLVLYDLAMRTDGLDLFLNTSLTDVLLDDGTRGSEANAEVAEPDADGYTHRPARNSSRRIRAIEATVANAETKLTLEASIFLDCTGDGLLAHLAGCEWRMGTEAHDEHGEIHAPEKRSGDVMGNSIHFKAVDVGRPVPFNAPDWAVYHEDPSYFYDQGRVPPTVKCGYWWIEVGVPWHTIYESEDIRHELTRHTLGIWDWLKNRDERWRDKAANYALDWIGQVPGKRESRRIMGRTLLTENEIQENKAWPDEIAYGGWFVDLHTPGGLLASSAEPHSVSGYQLDNEYIAKSYVGPYGIPLGCCISCDIDNLMMAGRNVSATHAALGTVRVMATTALMGEACGVAAAHAIDRGIDVGELAEQEPKVVQQDLLRGGVFLPNVPNLDDADLARQASVTASSHHRFAGVNAGGATRTQTLADANPHEFGNKRSYRLTHGRAQWIAVGGGRLDSVGVCLSNHHDQPREVSVKLEAVDYIWDYRADTGSSLANGTLVVPPGGKHWVDWPVDLDQTVPDGGYVRLTLDADERVEWHPAEAVPPGQVSAFNMRANKLRRFGGGEAMAFRVNPPQACYRPDNVISGYSRHRDRTHLWQSDPALPLPQSISLKWDRPQTVGHVELTFPGHLLKEYHSTKPLSCDPHTPRDYAIEVRDGSGWRPVLTVEGNYQRHRTHDLPRTVETSELRLTVHATNGDAAAGVFEFRVY